MKVAKYPSNLVQMARVNEKYEFQSFQNPQIQQNLKTLELVKHNDPILGLNPSFYSGVMPADRNPLQEVKQDRHFMNRQIISDLIKRSEYDHPLSFHNTTLKQVQYDEIQNQFPNLNENAQTYKFNQNGFYSKEPITLEKQFVDKTSAYLMPLDQRLATSTKTVENVFAKENLLYKQNELLMREIEIARKEKEYIRLQREKQSLDSNVQYSVQESTSPIKQQSHQHPQIQNSKDRTTDSKQQVDVVEYTISPQKQSMFNSSINAPLIEDQYNRVRVNDEQNKPAKQIYIARAEPLNAYQSSPDVQTQPIYSKVIMDENCRKDLPPASQEQQRKYSQQKQGSPYKAVRFQEEEENRKQQMMSSNTSSSPEYNPLRRKEPIKEHFISSGEKSASSKGGRHSNKKYDSEDDSEDDSEEDEAEYDYKLAEKLERIKHNLKNDTSSVEDQQERDMSKMEEVLKRQRQRLEGGGSKYSTTNGGQFNQSQDEQINFELTKTIQSNKNPSARFGNEGQAATANLEKAYEDLEKEILEIKQKLQSSLGATQNHMTTHSQRSQLPHAHRDGGRISEAAKSPYTHDPLDEQDYSLSVSDLGNSLYGSGRMPSGGGHDNMIPKFKY